MRTKQHSRSDAAMEIGADAWREAHLRQILIHKGAAVTFSIRICANVRI